jgi:hypothetical protein
MEEPMITLIQRCGLALACLVLAGLPGTAQAEWTTGKITYFNLYTNSGGDNTSVKIGPYNLSATGSLAALLREAFLRKLTVSVSFYTTSCPTPVCGFVNAVTIQGVDVP